jgi:predicted anti-sigma-YlaC factor YlaD
VAEPPQPRPIADTDVVEVACREFVELVTEHLEGSLSEELERAISAHLELCEPCRIYLQQVHRTTAVLGTLPRPTLPAPAQERLLEVYTNLHGRRPSS